VRRTTSACWRHRWSKRRNRAIRAARWAAPISSTCSTPNSCATIPTTCATPSATVCSSIRATCRRCSTRHWRWRATTRWMISKRSASGEAARPATPKWTCCAAWRIPPARWVRDTPWRWAQRSPSASWWPVSASGRRTRPMPTSRTEPCRRRFRRAWAASQVIWDCRT